MRKRSIAAVSAIALLMASPSSEAAVPVEDNASIAMNLANWIKSQGQTAAQIGQLANLISIGELMTTALGDSLGGGLAALMGESRVALSNTMSAYNSIMRVPTTVDNELALLNPAGFQDLTLGQAISRAERIRRMAQSTAAANVSMSAKRTQQTMQRDAMQMKANELKWKSVGELGALQALGEQAGVANEFGRLSLQTLENISNNLDMETQRKIAGEEMVIQMAKDDDQAMRDRVSRGAGQPSSDLAHW